MDSGARRFLLLAGSVIAFVGFIIPGLYGVSYNPPANVPLAHVDISKLMGFHGAVSNSTGGVYNGFSGPFDLHITLYSIIFLFALGLLSAAIDIERMPHSLQIAHHSVGALGGILVILPFIWYFRDGKTPPEIRQLFVADLGGSKAAMLASHDLTASLGGLPLVPWRHRL